MTYTKQQLQDMLTASVCTVTFTKVNSNEVRVMPCTLKPELIPQPVTESTKTKKPNDAVLSVWCMDKKGWRSFRIDNVTDVVQSS